LQSITQNADPSVILPKSKKRILLVDDEYDVDLSGQLFDKAASELRLRGWRVTILFDHNNHV
jgi:hypothetical protein